MKHFPFFIWIFFIANISSAQTNGKFALNPDKPLSQYIISVWDKNEGLPSQSLTKVIQDSKDYLWICSYNGLYRFDGVEFKTFAKTDKGILRTNSFSAAKENAQGELFLGTGASGLLVYRNGSFDIFGGDSPRFNEPISSFHFGAKNQVWVGSRGSGLYVFEKDTFWLYQEEPLLLNITISDILETPDGTLWFGTEGNGVVKMKDGAFSYINEANGGLLGNKVSSLCQDREGRIWIGGNQGMNYLTPEGKLEVLKGSEGHYVNHIVEDSYGSIWFGTTKGLFRLNAKTKALEFISTKEGLPHANVSHFSFDHEGNLWIATYRGGLCRLKDTSFENYNEKNGISSATINTVCELDGNRILVATGNALHILENGKITLKPIKTNIPSAWIKHVSQASNGDMLVSTYSGFLTISPDGKEYLLDDSKGLPDNQVRVSFEDSKGYIWIGTRAGGAIKLNPSTKELKIFNEANKKLSSDFVMSIDQDQKGNLLFGLNDKGLDVMDPDGSITNYSIDKVGSNLVFNVHIDADNNYWLATNAGLTLMQADGTIARFTKVDGLGSDVIFDIQEDYLGDLWLTSSDGLLRVSKQSLLDFAQEKTFTIPAKVYSKDDGMVESECTGVTQSLKASNGKLYFPTLGGLTVFDPNYPLPKLPNPKVYINQIVIDGIAMNMTSSDISLEADAKRVVFYYTALHLSSPSQVTFQYQLEGYEKWVDAGTERKAIYTNINPGWHTFKVRASHDGKNWDTEEQGTIRFYKRAHFTETNWFYLLLVLAAISIGFLIYKNRMRQIKRRNEELEETVNQRTKQLQEQQALVVQQNEVLQQKQEEILTQNEELFQQQEEITSQRDHIEIKNIELSKQKEAIQRAYTNVHLLTEIGQQVTAVLDLPSIVQRTYERVNRLMDASGFGICTYHKQEQTVVYDGYIEKGQVLDIYVGAFKPSQDLASWCIENKKPVLINDIDLQYRNYIEEGSFKAKTGDTPLSLIYVPLLLKGHVLGAVTVQSFQKNAYSQQDIDLLLNLATYLAIAVENADAYHEVKKSHDIIKSKNKDIMDSLRYAETIQQSVLPSAETINTHVNNHFVLFRPKDVVSGDFYWFKEVDGKIFAASVDCTGHGVPGAFMSMIGNDLLDTIIMREKIFDPAKILSLMNAGIRTALQQDKQQNSDGMDMGLCMIEYQQGGEVEVVYVGAKRPLFYLQDGILQEEKGDRKSVGGWQKEDNPVYTNISLHLHKGDILYLTSDGYVDQSSPSGKKFGTGKLRTLLQSFSTVPIQQQGEILTTQLDEHQKDYHQRDDITMFILEL